jgi:hypothetical protein
MKRIMNGKRNSMFIINGMAIKIKIMEDFLRMQFVDCIIGLIYERMNYNNK